MDAQTELHVHLEGTLTPETVCEINPSIGLAEARAAYQFRDFRGFIESYIWVNRELTRPEHYGLATARYLESLAAQGVRYVELNLSIGVLFWKEQNADEMFQGALEGTRGSTVEVRWICDAVRQFGAEAGMRVAEFAARHRDDGVIGFGIGGDEARGPASWFRDVFAYARREGLLVLPHAGETVGPESVWEALEGGADRIAHGIRAIEDPVLVRHLADRQIQLDICITSNVLTGAVASLAQHPVRRLYDAGVPISLSTDDPGLFGTTLAREHRIAREVFGLPV